MTVSTGINRGQCLCGHIAFAARGEPIWVSHCHCLSCRRNTGCAIVTFAGFHRDQVQFSTDRRKFHHSSRGVQRGFCDQCGTPVSYESDQFPAEIHLYVSAFEYPENFEPQSHVYFAEKIHWFDSADDLPRHPGSGTG